ncbi:MAG: hypothetical protein BWY15_00518 [Firmicutes bacterium ADurb.Bin193]|nr:MAG: hypothetical protein BWY15_00518 [Firmicutes bacterium ADurb.Bin193]
MGGGLCGINSFAAYYGLGGKKDFEGFDLLILEPKGYTDDQIKALKSAGKVLSAYLSIVEMHPDDSLFGILAEDDFVKSGGTPIMNTEYGTYYMDITKFRIRELLLIRAEDYAKAGFDGFFLDTAGNIELLNIEEEYRQRLISSAAELMREIKSRFPDKSIIQNNALLKLCDLTAGLVDGICFENPPLKTAGNLIWTLSAFKKLASVAKEKGITVFVLQEETADLTCLKSFAIKKLSKMKGFLYYRAPKHYGA